MLPVLEKILKSPSGQTNQSLIEKAYKFAEKAHYGQKRLSGEDYIVHPLNVAYFLAKLGLDPVTISAGMLHDVLEDTYVNTKDLEKEFGKDITFLVEGVTKLRKIDKIANKENSTNKEHLESLKKMFFAMAEDIRVILIKLADKYHNMETLSFMPKNDQKRIALETLEIYAPIAARLGMGNLKGQLEDLAFPYVYPEEYSWLLRKVKEKYADHLDYTEKIKTIIKKRLQEENIPVIDLHSRAKHYYSLYQKLKKKDMDLEKIHDLVAVRIIVPDIKYCYEALGVIHKYYKPFPGLIKDYIALPKPNGYQSLHTTIFCEKGRLVEIQIRTEEMHDYAENGIAAHWAYSESGKKSSTKINNKEIEWVTELKKILKEFQTGESLTNIKIDFFKNRIFTFTPKGDVKDLPEGATPLDFAYAIHTELGHTTRGAKVNGKIVPLDYELKNGDVVEIIKGKEKKPSFDWLKIVKTALAKKNINSWLREQGHLKPDKTEHKKEEKNPVKKIKISQIKKEGDIIIAGQKGLLYKIAKCCAPEPGQKIIGYITLNRGITIHANSCVNLKKINQSDKRIVAASWIKKLI
jgi:GTP pyrophosphokinase